MLVVTCSPSPNLPAKLDSVCCLYKGEWLSILLKSIPLNHPHGPFRMRQLVKFYPWPQVFKENNYLTWG